MSDQDDAIRLAMEAEFPIVPLSEDEKLAKVADMCAKLDRYTDDAIDRLRDPKIAAAEIGRLVNRIIALAPVAGLYIGIRIEGAPTTPKGPEHGE